jgi:hypothetical protein
MLKLRYIGCSYCSSGGYVDMLCYSNIQLSKTQHNQLKCHKYSIYTYMSFRFL